MQKLRCVLGQGTSPYLPRGNVPCTYCKSLWIRASAKWINVKCKCILQPLLGRWTILYVVRTYLNSCECNEKIQTMEFKYVYFEHVVFSAACCQVGFLRCYWIKNAVIEMQRDANHCMDTVNYPVWGRWAVTANCTLLIALVPTVLYTEMLRMTKSCRWNIYVCLVNQIKPSPGRS